MPFFTITLGLVASWNVVFVVHSGPIGILSERSYCSLVSNGKGTVVAWYFVFCDR